MFAHPQIPEYEYDKRVLRCSPAKHSTARTPQAARTAPAGRRGSHTPWAGRRPAQVPSAPGRRFSQVSKWKYTKQARYLSTKGSQSIKTPGGFWYFERANFTGLVLGYIETDFSNPFIRWKALAEIYTMHSVAKLCNLKFSSKCCHFSQFCKI